MKKSSRRYSRDLAPDEMRRLVNYDPNSGKLTWRVRDSRTVSSRQTGDPTKRIAAWNAAFAGKPCLTRLNKGYLTGTVQDRLYAAHRVAWAIHHGDWPAHAIDHIDGNRENNRISNLRLADAETNARNRGVGVLNRSGFLGVRWCDAACKWHAQIDDHYGRISLGYYVTKVEAIAARLGAEKVLTYHQNHGKRLSPAARRRTGDFHQQELTHVAA